VEVLHLDSKVKVAGCYACRFAPGFLTLPFSFSSCRPLALIGAEGESFFLEIDFYRFEIVENVLT
jgi:hypothetical protein